MSRRCSCVPAESPSPGTNSSSATGRPPRSAVSSPRRVATGAPLAHPGGVQSGRDPQPGREAVALGGRHRLGDPPLPGAVDPPGVRVHSSVVDGHPYLGQAPLPFEHRARRPAHVATRLIWSRPASPMRNLSHAPSARASSRPRVLVPVLANTDLRWSGTVWADSMHPARDLAGVDPGRQVPQQLRLAGAQAVRAGEQVHPLGRRGLLDGDRDRRWAGSGASPIRAARSVSHSPSARCTRALRGAVVHARPRPPAVGPRRCMRWPAPAAGRAAAERAHAGTHGSAGSGRARRARGRAAGRPGRWRSAASCARRRSPPGPGAGPASPARPPRRGTRPRPRRSASRPRHRSRNPQQPYRSRNTTDATSSDPVRGRSSRPNGLVARPSREQRHRRHPDDGPPVVRGQVLEPDEAGQPLQHGHVGQRGRADPGDRVGEHEHVGVETDRAAQLVDQLQPHGPRIAGGLADPDEPLAGALGGGHAPSVRPPSAPAAADQGYRVSPSARSRLEVDLREPDGLVRRRGSCRPRNYRSSQAER